MPSIHNRHADPVSSDDLIVLVTDKPGRWLSAVRQWRAAGLDVVTCSCAITAEVLVRGWTATFTDAVCLVVVCQSAAQSVVNNWAPAEANVPPPHIAVGYRWAGTHYHDSPATALRLAHNSGLLATVFDGDPPAYVLGWYKGLLDGREGS